MSSRLLSQFVSSQGKIYYQIRIVSKSALKEEPVEVKACSNCSQDLVSIGRALMSGNEENYPCCHALHPSTYQISRMQMHASRVCCSQRRGNDNDFAAAMALATLELKYFCSAFFAGSVQTCFVAVRER